MKKTSKTLSLVLAILMVIQTSVTAEELVAGNGDKHHILKPLSGED